MPRNLKRKPDNEGGKQTEVPRRIYICIYIYIYISIYLYTYTCLNIYIIYVYIRRKSIVPHNLKRKPDNKGGKKNEIPRRIYIYM